MKRREFVKGLAGVPLALMASTLGRSESRILMSSMEGTAPKTRTALSTASPRLNVVVHGMFAIVLDRKVQKKVWLKAPVVSDHNYLAQTFIVDPGNSKNLLPGWSYTPSSGASDCVQFSRGPDATLQRIRIGQPDHLAINVGGLKPGANPYWTIELPVPDDICGLRPTPINYLSRCIDADNCPADKITDNPTYKNNEMFYEQQCPLIYVLTYTQIKAGDAVIFSGNKQPVQFDSLDVGRLHVFAERPDQMVTPNAILALDSLFLNDFKQPLTLYFPNDNSVDSVGPDKSANCDDNKTILPCEERSLSELSTPCTEFPNRQTNDEQYATFYKKLKELSEESKGPNQTVSKSLRKTDRQRSVEERRELAAALAADNPNNVKPPTNCMSVICIQES